MAETTRDVVLRIKIEQEELRFNSRQVNEFRDSLSAIVEQAQALPESVKAANSSLDQFTRSLRDVTAINREFLQSMKVNSGLQDAAEATKRLGNETEKAGEKTKDSSKQVVEAASAFKQYGGVMAQATGTLGLYNTAVRAFSTLQSVAVAALNPTTLAIGAVTGALALGAKAYMDYKAAQEEAFADAANAPIRQASAHARIGQGIREQAQLQQRLSSIDRGVENARIGMTEDPLERLRLIEQQRAGIEFQDPSKIKDAFEANSAISAHQRDARFLETFSQGLQKRLEDNEKRFFEIGGMKFLRAEEDIIGRGGINADPRDPNPIASFIQQNKDRLSRLGIDTTTNSPETILSRAQEMAKKRGVAAGALDVEDQRQIQAGEADNLQKIQQALSYERQRQQANLAIASQQQNQLSVMKDQLATARQLVQQEKDRIQSAAARFGSMTTDDRQHLLQIAASGKIENREQAMLVQRTGVPELAKLGTEYFAERGKEDLEKVFKGLTGKDLTADLKKREEALRGFTDDTEGLIGKAKKGEDISEALRGRQRQLDTLRGVFENISNEEKRTFEVMEDLRKKSLDRQKELNKTIISLVELEAQAMKSLETLADRVKRLEEKVQRLQDRVRNNAAGVAN